VPLIERKLDSIECRPICLPLDDKDGPLPPATKASRRGRGESGDEDLQEPAADGGDDEDVTEAPPRLPLHLRQFGTRRLVLGVDVLPPLPGGSPAWARWKR
jgi:hypothetical protein